MKQICLDAYIIDTLMADLVGHDRCPSAFLVFLHLWRTSFGMGRDSVAVSLSRIAYETGLSKSSVQNGIKLLKRRGLIATTKTGPTTPPVYRVLHPWRDAEGRQPL